MTRGRQSVDNCNYSLAAELLAAAGIAKSAKDFRNRAMNALGAEFADARLAWVHQFDQRWEAAGSAGSLANLPIELAANAADQMSMLLANNWLAVPVSVAENWLKSSCSAPETSSATKRPECWRRCCMTD